MSKKHFVKRALPMTLAAAMVFTSVPVMAAPNDLSGHWAEKVMTEWQAKGLIKGYEDGTVKPDNAVSRAEFVIMMNNALGLKGSSKVSFTDVKEGDWYYNAVATAVEAGYCKGYDDGTFKPSATITRAEAAIMTANAAGLTSNAAGAAGFVDAAVIPAWAKGSVGAVVEAGFMSGYPDGTFGAAASIKRAEAVSSLNRVMGNKVDTPVVPEEEEKTETDDKKGSGGGGGGGSSSGGGSGSGGGGTTPTVPTVTKTVKTSEELDAAIDADAANKNVVINVGTDAVLAEDVDAIFNGKELTINFNNVDMAGNLEIIASNATKIDLNDTKTGVDGTEVGTLTIDAPNAEVVSNIVANTVDIIAVKYGTFHAKDIVNNGIEIKKGALEVAASVADTTKVTVPEEATGDVKIKGKVKEVNIDTTQKVALDAEVTTANVTKEGAKVAGTGSIATANVSAAATIDTKKVETLDVKEPVAVTVGENADVKTVEISADAAEISGAGAIAKIEATNDVTVSATKVTEVEVGSEATVTVKADVANVTVPENTTGAKIEVAENTTVSNVTASSDVTVAGAGTITKVDVETKENEEVKVSADADATVKVDAVVNTGSGEVKVENVKDTAGETVVAKKVTGIRVDATSAKTTYKAGEELDLTGVKVVSVYDDGSDAESFDVKGNASVTVSPTVVGDTAGTVTITVEYAGMKTTYNVTVTLDTTALESKIAEANALLNGEYWTSVDGSDIAQDKQWVTADMKKNLKDAMYAAEEGLAGYTTQTQVNDAVSALETAISEFKPVYGTYVELDLTALNAKVAEANAELAKNYIISEDGSDVPVAEQWVTQAMVNAVASALEAAEAEFTTQAQIDTVVASLEAALTAFKPVYGTYVEFVLGTVVLAERDYVTNGETNVVESGSITLEISNGAGYSADVAFGLREKGTNNTPSVQGNFAPKNGVSTTEGISILYLTSQPAVEYDVVYKEAGSSEWKTTGTTVDLSPVDEEAFSVTEVKGTRVDCFDNGETVESGTITVTFTFENYADAVKFGLMEHCDNDEDIVATEATYTRVNESETEGSVTFAMTGVPVANYEVVYYLADVETWVGTNEYIDLTKTDEPALSTTITLTQNGNQVFASWEDCGCERYTWAFLDSTGDVEELQWTDGNECVTWDIVPLIPRVESGTAAYDFVVYELDKNDEDWIGKELGRVEDAIVVTASGSAVGYTMEFTDAANGKYRITLDDVPAVNDVFLNMWTKTNGHAYCSEYFSDGGQSYEETTFMGALTEGDVYDLRKVSFNVTDNKLNVAMTPASETTYGAAVEEPDEEVNFMLNGSGNDFYMTWNDMEYSGYRIDIGDNKIWITDGSNKSRNLLHFIPCVDESATYDIVLNGLDAEFNATELARLKDALEVTVSGSAAEYTAEFSETGVTATWTPEPEGVAFIHKWKNTSSYVTNGGGSPITPQVTANNNLTGGEVFDLRVVTAASLSGQVMSVTMTPASETTYTVTGGDETTNGVDVTLTEDTVVVMPEVSPSVEFRFENLTEATTISTYVVTTKGASEADAKEEVKTQDVSAGTKYATIGLYSATFNEVGTYYVYYKVGDGAWCEEPLEITVTEPVEPTVSLKASRIKGVVGEAISKNVKIELKNDTFSVEMKVGTDVTEWFTNMPENWTATVAEDVAVGDNLMVVTIACDADKAVAGSGFVGVTVPADVLKAGNALTAVETFAYTVEKTVKIVFAEGSDTIKVDGESVSFEQKFFCENGVDLMPLHMAAELLKIWYPTATVAFDENAKSALFNYDSDEDDDLIFTMGSNEAIVNGETVTMNNAAVIVEGYSTIPVQDFFSLLGESTWSKAEGIVTVNLSLAN